jgi:putative membrane protein
VPKTDWVRSVLAVLLVVLGGLVTLLAMVRWARVERAMRTRRPLPAFSLGYLLTGAVVVGAALLALAFV